MLTRRRLGVLAAVLLLWRAFLAGAGYVLGGGRLDAARYRAVRAVSPSATPWAVLGFCNALSDFGCCMAREIALAAVAPFLPAMESVAPLNVRTAVLMTLRNEDPARALCEIADGEGQSRCHRRGRGLQLFPVERYRQA